MKIGCVIVSYNVSGIITRAVESIKPYVDKVVVIDHSQKAAKVYREVDKLDVMVRHTGRNKGHGLGLHMGIEMLDCEKIILMDSDAVLKDPKVIDIMLNMFDEKTYGVGQVNQRFGVDYLHPYFAMIDREKYFSYKPLINHGAPFKDTMGDIHDKVVVKGIKELPKYVWHEGRRTRKDGKKI